MINHSVHVLGKVAVHDTTFLGPSGTNADVRTHPQAMQINGHILSIGSRVSRR